MRGAGVGRDQLLGAVHAGVHTGPGPSDGARELALSALEEVVLLKQPHVNQDKYGGKTIEELRTELSGTTGENVVIRRFARFAVSRA